MHLADTIGPGYPNYDGHYFEHRRLDALAHASVDYEHGVVTGAFEVQNLYGNSPSGMPTSAPSSSSPTTVKSRLEDKGLYAAKTTPSLWTLLPYIFLWFVAGSLYSVWRLLDIFRDDVDSSMLSEAVLQKEKEEERRGLELKREGI